MYCLQVTYSRRPFTWQESPIVKSRPIWKLNKLTNFQGIVMFIRLISIMKVVLTRLNEGSVLEINVCLLIDI